MENRKRSVIFTILAPILWSLGGVGIRSLTVNSWTIIFYRSIFMSLTIFLFLIFYYKKNSIKFILSIGINGLFLSLLLAFTTFFYVLSISKTAVANALLLQGTAPIWATLLGYFVLKEKINILNFLTIILSFVGIIIIIIGNEINLSKDFINLNNFNYLLGNFYALITGFGLAGQILIVRKNPNLNLIPSTIFGGLIACFLSIFFKPTFVISVKNLLILFLLGTFQIGLGYILFYKGSKNLPAYLSGLITLIETVLGPIWVFIFFKEMVSLKVVIGGIIILISIVLNLISNNFKFVKTIKN